MFYSPPHHKSLAKKITIESVSAAQKAGRKLIKESKRAKRPSAVLRRARAATLAANRAEALAKKRNLSKKEKIETKRVAKIWRGIANKLYNIYRRKRKK